MSDTVKVIIEIPKEIYERCKEYKLWSYDAETLEGAVAQGIPLDSVKAEIEALSNANPSYWHSGDMVEREEVLEILDNVTNAESEDK